MNKQNAGVTKIINGHAVLVIRGGMPTGARKSAILRGPKVGRTQFLIGRAVELGLRPWCCKRTRTWHVGQWSLERWASNNNIGPSCGGGALHGRLASSSGAH